MDPFDTDAELDVWVRANRLDHVRQLGADVLFAHIQDVPARPPGLRNVLERHRFTDFATVESLKRYGYALSYAPTVHRELPSAARRFLADESLAIAQARSEEAARLAPPSDPRAEGPFRSLLALRALFPASTPPRVASALPLDALTFDPQLPGFRYRDDRRWLPRLGYSLVLPSAELRISPSAASVSCRCGAERCPHALAAVDAALSWLRQPVSEPMAVALAELSRPTWQRALTALDNAFAERTRATGGVAISWRLSIYGARIEVAPFVHRLTRKGGLSSGSRVSAHKLIERLRDPLAPHDARIAELCASAGGAASQALLFALEGHPRLYLDDQPEQTVHVERVKVGIVAEQRADRVVVGAGVDGTTLGADHLERLREARPEEPLFLWDPGRRRLSVLDVGADLRPLLDVFSRFGSDFPPESHAALLESLSRVASRVPVAMPRSVMGEAAVPRADPVVRLELQSDGSVRLDLRVRPLPETATFGPGDGPREVYARRAAVPLHARRDFEAEVLAARALQASLPLSTATSEAPFTFVFPDAQGALALLGMLTTRESPPELEWVGAPLRWTRSGGPPELKVTLERRRDWFGVLGGLSVAGERVELAVLLDAARRRQRFVRVESRSYVELADALRVHLERLADHAYASRHGLEIGPSAVETLQALSDAGAEVTADAAWQQLAARIFAAKELKPRVPRTLKGRLRDYQLEGFRWLTRLAAWGAGGVLADDMGLGKTVQALAVMLDRAKLGPALVLAPTSVGFNWVDEAARFAPSLRMVTYADSTDRGRTLESLGPGQVLVLSYGLLTKDLERLKAVKFSTIVFDEAQALKNVSTRRARAACELQGEFKMALSGTPLENHLGELWSLARAVFPGLLGSWEAFRSRYATPIERRVDPTAAPALARVLQPFLLRRTKAQVEKELPSRTEIRVPVVLSPEEWQLYEDARLAALSELETPKRKLKEQERRIQVLAALTRLRLLASHPRLHDPASTLESAKLSRMLELVEELTREGHRALVFSQFTSHLALVREVLDARGTRYQYLDGRTPRRERERRVREFQEGADPLFLISLKAGGFGLNLTGADNVIHLDPWWNPAVEDQASDRAHRIGQTRPVTIYRLVARGTIEEQILSLHEEKRALVAGVLEGKDQAGRLSTQELLSLLTQKPTALTWMNVPRTRH